MKKFILWILFLTAPIYSFGAEQIDLSSAFVVDPSSTTLFKVEYLNMNWMDKKIFVGVRNGKIREAFSYTGTTALNLMNSLNKANLTSNSLHRRILNQLISDGYLSGSVNGSPD